MPPSRGYLFVSYYVKLLLVYCLGLGLLLLSRIVFVLTYGDLFELKSRSWEVFLAFIVGFRTDTMSLSYGLFPCFLVLIGIWLVSGSRMQGYLKFTDRFLIIYSVIIFCCFSAVLIADFFFFRFFNDHLNVLVFAIVDDDTTAVLASMWTDYPAVRVLLLMIGGAILFNYAVKRIARIKIKSFQPSNTISVWLFAVALILVFTAMRNSWETFPFRMQNTIVSDNTFVNKIGIGGVYSLQNAVKNKMAENINTDIRATLKKYKFASTQAVIDSYLDDDEKMGHEFPGSLISRTNYNSLLAQKRPHVVVVQMESMSNHLLDFHSSEFNLLGALEKPLSEAYVFRNFVSASWTTIHSLEALIVASPETPISQSGYSKVHLSSSAPLPYLKAGYNTAFVTGAELAWRNLDGYLSNVYFNEVEGNISLKKNNAKATEAEWGTHDEFMFDRIFQRLEQADSIPQFIYAMTTTNHTPYDLPASYEGYSLKVPAAIESILKADRDVAERNFRSYQYANDCLGKFISKIQNSPMGENTIIVAVGDHSISQLFNTGDDLLLKKLSVPFILFVPPAYRPRYKVDVTRFGSHKDVFPTVFNLTLSNAEYIKSGNNLMAPPNDSSYYFGVFRYRTGFSKDGCVMLEDNLTFNWADNSCSTLVPANLSKKSEYLGQKVRAYSAALSCFIKDELSKRK